MSARLVASLLLAALFAFPFAAHASAPEGATLMLRSPTVSATHIAFAYAQDLWVVPRAGGDARRLTSSPGQERRPRFSPDGRWIAFTAQYAGNGDVYVVPTEGGEPRRLTWHPGDDEVQGWTPDGKSVLFASGRATWAPTAAPRFWTVPATGGPETPLALARAFQGRLSPDGKRVAFRLNNSWDEERRNYRGGQNRPVWITDLATLATVTPAWDGSKDMEPVWLGDRVVFISDRDGVANLWSCDAQGKDLRQHTRFTDDDVKSVDAAAGTVVFERAGALHELDPATGTVRTLSIRATGDFPWMMPRWEDVSARLTNLSLSPTGKRVLVEARGEVFTIPADKGDVRNLTRSSGSAEREPAWSPDGRWIAYWSDAPEPGRDTPGESRLRIESAEGTQPARTLDVPNPGRAYGTTWSPDSKRLLYTDTNLNLWVVEVATGQARRIGRDPWMVPTRTMHPSWSPDSRWVAWSAHLNTLYRAIMVADVVSGATHQVTDGMADAVHPVWDAGGKLLWFLGSTDYGLRSQWLDMTSYDREETFALYAVVLAKDGATPFPPESDEDAGVATGEKGEAKGEAKGDAKGAKPGAGAGAGAGPGAKDAAPGTPPVRIDPDGIGARIVAAPGLPTRAYTGLQAGVAGTVFVLELPAGAEAARGGPAPASTLHRYKVADRKAAVFANDVASYAVSADGRKLVWRVAAPGGGPGGPPAAGAPSAPPTLYLVDADKTPPTAGSGKLPYSLRMWLEPVAEFRQIFHEGWRTQRDYYYVPNLHGTDWPRMREHYGKLLPYVRHRADLNELLDRMGAETATGHSYVRGGDLPEMPSTNVGLLGADLVVESGRWRIARIYDNERWNPELKAPLAAPGLRVSAGDWLLAINGEELRGDDNPYRLLDGTANKQTVLTVHDRPSLEGARTVTVVPVASEQTLRTRAWVESNRRRVDQLSGGRLAYVYVPNTGMPGYTSFNRYYFAQQDREGVVVDERYNGGGSAADYMIEVMQRTFDGYFNNVAGDRVPFTSPSAGIWGPKVMIVNEMAGSGGDYLPYMFRARKLGTIVGKRTWGGLVHTADTPPFVDGGSMIAPRGGYFAAEGDGRWAVENEGVAPDVDVENWPADVAAGRDPQLEKAVEVALRQLAEKPVRRLMKEPPPPTWGRRP